MRWESGRPWPAAICVAVVLMAGVLCVVALTARLQSPRVVGGVVGPVASPSDRSTSPGESPSIGRVTGPVGGVEGPVASHSDGDVLTAPIPTPLSHVFTSGETDHCALMERWRWESLGPDGTRYAEESSPSPLAVGGSAALKKALIVHSARQIALWQSVFGGGNESKVDPLNERYLVWDPPGGGLGNRAGSLVAVMAMALVTDRVLVLGEELGPFACPPIAGPPWSQWLRQSEELRHLSSHTMYVIHTKPPPEMAGIVCGDPRLSIPEQVLRIHANQYFVPMLWASAALRPTLLALFPDMDLFGPLGRFLLQPSREVSERVRAFRLEHFSGRTVGFQLRRHSSWTRAAVEWSVELEKCTNLLVEGASTLFLATAGPPPSLLRKKFGEGSRRLVQVPFNKTDKAIGPYVDVLLLSACDDLVVSTLSTFGYLAHALSSQRPLLLHTTAGCTRVESSQPCMHAWRGRNTRAKYRNALTCQVAPIPEELDRELC